MVDVGIILPPDQPPERLRSVAQAADASSLDELWLWEDCFAESGVAPAAAALAWTQRISVGIGLMPVPLRAVALAAMELATLERLFPGRVLPGIGHGVLEWMGQAGVRVDSPLTLLREHATALRALLAGETVTTEGRYVQLDDVQLRWPPETAPPVLVGGVRPKTLALAGELGDGVIFTGGTDADAVRRGLATVRGAWDAAGRAGSPHVVVFTSTAVGTSATDVAEHLVELAEAGATSVPVCIVESVGGAPVADERILEGLATVADARSMLRADG
jgi:alkanesulfonate monooxygenase SsuD/methylene tetrahydromethanopterin reductase-like flavin-dependent oxidoreductase (luciferase family)